MESSKCLLYVYLLVNSIFLVAGSREKCTTPKQENGVCVPILRCKSLVELLKKVHQTPDNRDFLRSSRCGDINGGTTNVHVCCPTSEFGSDPIAQSDGLLAPLSVCGLQNENRLISGNITAIDEFPWLVQLFYTENGRQPKSICSGVLINNDHVVTAAQCVDSRKLQTRGLLLDSVRLGEWNTKKENDCECAYKSCDCDCTDPIVDIKIAQVIAHDVSDIAVIRLSKKIENFTEFITPICLPQENSVRSETEADVNMNFVTVSGWGDEDKGYTTDMKGKREVRLVRDSECVDVYKQNQTIIDPVKQICAGNDTNDACIGNPGAPLMYIDRANGANWRLIGILSSGPQKCDTKGFPGIYTRISDHTDWIVDQLVRTSFSSASKE